MAGSSSNPQFTFDRTLNRFRYKDTGRLVSRAKILALVQDFRIALDKQSDRLVEAFVEGRITPQEFKTSFASLIKIQHVQALILGRGGVDKVTPEDYLALARDLKNNHYPRLAQFIKQYEAGLLSKQQTKARARLYSRSTRGSLEYGKRQAEVENGGATDAQRSLANCVHCPSCLKYAALGRKPIKEIPLPGTQCECAGNCRCSITYYKDTQPKKKAAKKTPKRDRSL